MRTAYQGWHVERMDEDCLPRMACGENGRRPPIKDGMWREWMKTVYQGWHVERMDEDHLSRMARGENG